jgi:hypothetical protein
MRRCTNGMDGECRAVRDGSVLAEEHDLRDDLSSGFLPPVVKMILSGNAVWMLE